MKIRVKTILKRLTRKYSRQIGSIWFNTTEHRTYCLMGIPTGKMRVWNKIPTLFPVSGLPILPVNFERINNITSTISLRGIKYLGNIGNPDKDEDDQ